MGTVLDGMQRRTFLAASTLVVAGSVAGCLTEQSTGTPADDDAGAEPDAGDQAGDDQVSVDQAGGDGPSQFQADPQNTGVVGGGAPDDVRVDWQTGISPIDGGLSIVDGRLVVVGGGEATVLDAADGTEQWTRRVGHDTEAPPALSADTAYVTAWNGGAQQDRGVAALALDDGEERWRAVPDVDVNTAPTLADGTVFVGGSLNSRAVIAIDAATGDEHWRFEAGQYATTPAVADGTVFVGGGKEHVAYALSATDGAELWRFETDGRVWGAPTVRDGTVYVGSRSGHVYALDAANGEERWRTHVGAEIPSSIAATAEQLLVSTRESVVALDTAGERQWSVDVVSGAHPPLVTTDRVVVADGRTAYCLDAASGDTLWSREGTEQASGDAVYVGIDCAPIVADGRVYVASHGGDVHALGPVG